MGDKVKFKVHNNEWDCITEVGKDVDKVVFTEFNRSILELDFEMLIIDNVGKTVKRKTTINNSGLTKVNHFEFNIDPFTEDLKQGLYRYIIYYYKSINELNILLTGDYLVK